MILPILMAIIVIGNYTIGHNQTGEHVNFTMTKKLQEESQYLQLCETTNVHFESCEMIYGGLNKSYGEKLN
jgi:hypothetical protein